MLYNFEFSTTEDSNFFNPKFWKTCLVTGALALISWYRVVLALTVFDIFAIVYFCFFALFFTIVWFFMHIPRRKLPIKVIVTLEDEFLTVKICSTNKRGKEKRKYRIYTIKYNDIKFIDFVSSLMELSIDSPMSVLEFKGFFKPTEKYVTDKSCTFRINASEALELGIAIEEISSKRVTGIRTSDVENSKSYKMTLPEVKSVRESVTSPNNKEYELHYEFQSSMDLKTLLPKCWYLYVPLYVTSLCSKVYLLWDFVVQYNFNLTVLIIAVVTDVFARLSLVFKPLSPCITSVDFLPNCLRVQKTRVGGRVKEFLICTVDYGSITKITYSPADEKLVLMCTSSNTYKKGNRENTTRTVDNAQLFRLNSEVGPIIADILRMRTDVGIDDVVDIDLDRAWRNARSVSRY